MRKKKKKGAASWHNFQGKHNFRLGYEKRKIKESESKKKHGEDFFTFQGELRIQLALEDFSKLFTLKNELFECPSMRTRFDFSTFTVEVYRLVKLFFMRRSSVRYARKVIGNE